MNVVKFGADLGGEGGHIILTDEYFMWSPVLGSNTMKMPISDIIGYRKQGLHVVLVFSSLPKAPMFYTWQGDALVRALKMRNPNIEEMTQLKVPATANMMVYVGISIGLVVILFFAFIIGRFVLAAVMH